MTDALSGSDQIHTIENQNPDNSNKNQSSSLRTGVITTIALVGIGLVATGLLAHFGVIATLSGIVSYALMGTGGAIILGLAATGIIMYSCNKSAFPKTSKQAITVMFYDFQNKYSPSNDPLSHVTRRNKDLKADIIIAQNVPRNVNQKTFGRNYKLEREETGMMIAYNKGACTKISTKNHNTDDATFFALTLDVEGTTIVAASLHLKTQNCNINGVVSEVIRQKDYKVAIIGMPLNQPSDAAPAPFKEASTSDSQRFGVYYNSLKDGEYSLKNPKVASNFKEKHPLYLEVNL